MSDFTQIRCSRDGAVATVALARPEALNAITPTMLAELGQAMHELAEDPGVVVVVLTGEGRAFSAGVDLKALGARKLEQGKVGDILDLPAGVDRGDHHHGQGGGGQGERPLLHRGARAGPRLRSDGGGGGGHHR
ncbi:MAG: enoyl-CoA hydratase/isomerase family protein [Acidimicrobiales bacterium]